MTDAVKPRRRERPRRPIERAEILIIIVLAVIGAVWGAAWQRSASLTEIASLAPAMMIVIGPGLLITYLAYRVVKGEFELRMDGYGTVVLFIGALGGNLATPPLSPMVVVNGSMTVHLEGSTAQGAARCTWAPGRESVSLVTFHIGTGSGQQQDYFSPSVPAGTLNLEPRSGSIWIDNIPVQVGMSHVPVRNGALGLGNGPAQGSLSLDPANGALVPGDVSWTCDPPPAK